MQTIIEKIKAGEELSLDEQLQMMEAPNAGELFKQYVQKYELCEDVQQLLLDFPNAVELVSYYLEQGYVFAGADAVFDGRLD
ncbi:MAG: hypothetical protein J6B00_01345 [Alphaproteobacteria bacterium]|nr:hypothetical protein [Alphaproteobacteria bacterium]